MISRLRLSTEVRPHASLADQLEQRFNVARAVPVARAALGLRMVLEHWREGRGRCRVALPAAICHEVVVAVLAAKCEPIFCDVDPADGLATVPEWARARALGADVAIVVHLYGNPADIEAVREIFPAPRCLLIDDAAQALGSHGAAFAAGAGGDVGLLSFGPTKQIAVGNAALLFTRDGMAEAVSVRLRGRTPELQSVRGALTAAFRARLETARERLRGAGDVSGFAGLLQGLEPLLEVPLAADAEATMLAIDNYPRAAQLRVAKMEQWERELEGTGLEPVGMAQGCIPWRYTCRLPGIDWLEQHRIAEALRESGMHVSNWYLPAHWFLGRHPGVFPGAERLAREVFQFWLDESTTSEAIAKGGAIVRGMMTS